MQAFGERTAMDGDLAFRLAELRGHISDLGGAIRQLQRSGLDSASAQLLITRKRAELECLMNLRSGTGTRPATHSASEVSSSDHGRSAHRSNSSGG
jgi:hypothetical protein